MVRNPTATAHVAGSTVAKKVAGTGPMARRQQETQSPDGPEIYFPNSLVIVAAAGLLESIVSSQKDTSSPELIHKVLDLLSERYEVLIHMLRSTSFLIMENASILMFVLLKNRPQVTGT